MFLKSFNHLSIIVMVLLSGHIKAGAAAEVHLLASNAARSVKVYAVPFFGFASKIEVSACYGHFEGNYLLLHRSSTLKDLPGIWGVPGGKVHARETKEQANAREFYEETGIRLPSPQTVFFRTVYITDPFKDFIFHMFTYEFLRKPAVKLNPREHQAYAWLSPKDAMKLSLIPGEAECFELLRQRFPLPLV